MIHKTFVILEALAVRKGKATISEISEITDIPRSTVHRILKALAEEEVVIIKPKKNYELTPKLISIGLNGLVQRDLYEIAAPFMRDIAGKTRETVSLNIISGYERVCIYRIEGDYPITRNIRIGDKGPLFRGSAGKIIAAGLSEIERDSVIKRYIETGIIEEVDVPGILEEMKIVQQRGFAMSIGERVKNGVSIGVPVKDISGNPQASLSISTVGDRFTEEEKQKYLDLLFENVKQINAAQGLE